MLDICNKNEQLARFIDSLSHNLTVFDDPSNIKYLLEIVKSQVDVEDRGVMKSLQKFILYVIDIPRNQIT